jgi:hypothetical protein
MDWQVDACLDFKPPPKPVPPPGHGSAAVMARKQCRGTIIDLFDLYLPNARRALAG